MGGGENGPEFWTEFEVRTDTNGSNPSSGLEPKSEAASCTVLMLSYTRSLQDVAGPRSETKRGNLGANFGLFVVRRMGGCALARLLFALPTAGVKKLLSGNSGGRT